MLMWTLCIAKEIASKVYLYKRYRLSRHMRCFFYSGIYIYIRKICDQVLCVTDLSSHRIPI